jgi:tetratricopeptide (TPR) repeat protein
MAPIFSRGFMNEIAARMTAPFRIDTGRVFFWLALMALPLLSACAHPAPVREAEYPIDCRKEDTIKDLLRRGDVHRNLMMREIPEENTSPERWTEIRAIHGDRARMCYQLVLDAKPDHPYALVDMGFSYVVESTFPGLTPEAREKSLVTATGYMQKALTSRRLDAQSYYYLGEIAARRGQCDDAMKIFSALLTSRWSYSQVYAWIGYCDEEMKKPLEARAAYQKAVEISNPVEISEWAKTKIK